jgi:hypothetical protein
MFNNKKGVAEIITTILIILLVLAVIVIVWQVIVPLVSQSTGQVTMGCVTVRLSILQPNQTTSSFSVKRDAGIGDLQFIRVILTNSSGGIYTKDVPATDLGELGVKKIDNSSVGTVNWTSTGINFTTVNIAAMVTPNKVLCSPPYSTPVTLSP